MRQRIPTPASLITGSNRCIQLVNDFLPKTRLIFPTPPPEKNFYIPYVAKFSPHDFLRIAVAGERGRIAFISGDLAIKNEDIFTPINSKTVADDTIYDLVFMSNEKSVICIGSGDQSVRFIDTSTYQTISTHLYHKETPQTLTCFNDGVLSGGRDGQVCFWDRKISANPAYSVPIKNTIIWSVVAPTNDIFITGDSQGRILVWDPRNLKSPYHVPLQKSENNVKKPIVNLAISPNGKMMSSISTNDTLKIFSLDGEWRYYSFHRPKIGDFFSRSCFSPDSRYVVTGSGSGAVCCFSLDNNKQPLTLLEHSAPATCVEWCKDMFEVILSCSDDKTIQLWMADPELAKENEPEIEPFIPGEGTFNSIHERPPTITKIYTLHHFL